MLRAAPDPGVVAQESRDVAGRWIGASDAAIQEFGKAGGTLTNIVTGNFTGLSQDHCDQRCVGHARCGVGR